MEQLGRNLATGLFTTHDPDAPLALVRARVGGLEVFRGSPAASSLGGIRATDYECLNFSDAPELKAVYTMEGGWNLDELAALLVPFDQAPGVNLLAKIEWARAHRPCEVG